MLKEEHFSFLDAIQSRGWQNRVAGEAERTADRVRPLERQRLVALIEDLVIPTDRGDLHQLVRADIQDGPTSSPHGFKPDDSRQ